MGDIMNPGAAGGGSDAIIRRPVSGQQGSRAGIGEANLDQPDRDLGFGRVLSQEAQRLLNRDGTFNVARRRSSGTRRLLSYHGMLTASWPVFFALLGAAYTVLNLVFASAFWLCGTGALQGSSVASPFWQAFFFSVDTFSTIGYGNIAPVGYLANTLVTVEAVVGLLSFSLATGLVFARFARPTAQILFSENAVIAPYRGITAFEFRVVNRRASELINLSATVVLSRFEQIDGIHQRRYYPLALERTSVAFFPIPWTVVHPIDESSPLYQYDAQKLKSSGAEFLILLSGTDEVFAQTVHTRSSYSADEVKWGMRFASLFQENRGGLRIDLERFHSLEAAS